MQRNLWNLQGRPVLQKRYGELDTRTNQTEDARERPRRGSRLCRTTTDSSTD